jgi:hypothetical protein
MQQRCSSSRSASLCICTPAHLHWLLLHLLNVQLLHCSSSGSSSQCSCLISTLLTHYRRRHCRR